MTELDLVALEKELKQRWQHPYVWGRVQNDTFDARTRFVYHTPSLAQVLDEVGRLSQSPNEQTALRNYALNRWYNFWSARAVEQMFCALPNVIAAEPGHRTIDFTLAGIPFDHKTSIFPRGFAHDLSYALNCPGELMQWLYSEQSHEQRQHFENRLFVVLYAGDGAHWRLKAELAWLNTLIRLYVEHFDPARLWRLNLREGAPTLSDIIWAVRCSR